MSDQLVNKLKFDGTIHQRGRDGYEDARKAAVWNGRKPDRFPDWILVAAHAQDVVEAVRFANRNGLKIGIRSGGHSVVATGIRDGGLLIDLSLLRDVEVDVANRTAWVGPGMRGEQLGKQITPLGLTFPVGGCPTVGLGGYLLTGGYGLNGKTFGSGASNIKALDIVTADGELIRADEHTNADYFWAARGGGYGFFGVVVRFQLQLYEAPRHLARASYVFSIDDFDEFGAWFLKAMPDFDTRLMTLIFGVKHPDLGHNVARISALGFADTEAETREIFRPLEEALVMRRALSRMPPEPTTFDQVYAGVDLLYPEGCRYFADTCWIGDSRGPDFVGALKSAFASIPNRYSHVMMNPWIPEERDNAVLSGTTTLPFHMYGVAESPDEDRSVQEWINLHMERVVPFSNGVGKINESDLIVRNQHVLAPDRAARLEQLRSQYDPDGRFHSFLRQEN